MTLIDSSRKLAGNAASVKNHDHAQPQKRSFAALARGCGYQCVLGRRLVAEKRSRENHPSLEEGRCAVFLNDDIRREYLEVLHRFVDASALRRWQKWLAHPNKISLVHKHLPYYPELRDPTDNPFLSTAVFTQARYLISRDKDLLVLRKFHEVKIVKPEEFMKRYHANE